VSRVLVLNGPNLGQLGRREPETYGTTTYAELVEQLRRQGREQGLDVEVRQTDSEAELIGWLHGAADDADAVVLNPASLSHYSIALRDALSFTAVPVVEVHISNIAAREEFRHHSVVSAVVRGTITGLGLDSYHLALVAVARLLAREADSPHA
jgi:3-dehydroquinate dehydratase-2